MPEVPYFLLFIEVAQRRSISAAARELRMSRATATRRLASLEEGLGVQLVRRTTNELSLTQAGERYLEHAIRAQQALNCAEDAVRSTQDRVEGVLRLAAPILPSHGLITPLLQEFSRLHPEVRLDVVLDADVRKLVADGFDIGLQLGLDQNPSLRVRRLHLVQRRLLASSEYLERYGMPESVEDLENHACLVSQSTGKQDPWPRLDSPNIHIPSAPKLVCNSSTLLQSAAERGMGIALLPLVLAQKSLSKGHLHPVLDTQVGQDLWVSLVVATHRIVPPKVRAFVDFTVEWVKRNLTQGMGGHSK